MGNKLKAIIWKNLLFRRNGWGMTLYELIFPLSIILIINLFLPPIPNHVDPNTIDVLSNPFEVNHEKGLLYIPSNEFTDKFIKKTYQRLGYKLNNVVSGNISELTSRKYDMAIDFEDSNEQKLSYTIYPVGSWPETLPAWRDESYTITSNSAKYQLLAQIQYNIDAAFIDYIGSKSIKPSWLPQIVAVANMDKFSRETSIFGILVVLALFSSYLCLISPVITRIVEEKECGAKELMRMMGVRSWELWIGKLLDALMVIVTVAAGMVILLYVPLKAESTTVQHVSPIVFFFMIVMGMTSITVGLFFLSCLFQSPVLASSVASIIGTAAPLLLGLLQMSSAPRWRRIIYCLLPHMTLISSAHTLMKFEQLEKDVNWLERLSTDNTALTLTEILGMMIFDIFLYSLLTWYFDKIKPGKYGIPMPWNFFLYKQYWVPSASSPGESKLLKNDVAVKKGIYVDKLKKVYGGKSKQAVLAVDGLTMEAAEGRITALLGHNGAGKTTTMQIITGLIGATSGSVYVSGYDIQLNPDEARSSLGLCPQQDLLFQNLTVLQTLTFFGMIKGLSYSNSQREAKTLLMTFKMQEAKGKCNKDLSGGMKRKVSLGIALIGGSKVVILDEPTAGVDPELRREICDLLLSYRGERTVLLTTHIMEEADAISDYIYIMDHGKVQCSGTPLDLKTKFGTGYGLQVVVNGDVADKIMDVVKKTVKESRFKGRNAATLSFQLPSVETPAFPTLFTLLDQCQEAGEIVTYSMSISTLEDVFVRVREMEREGSDEVDGNPYVILASNTELNPGKLTGMALLWAQMKAIFTKAFLTFIRSHWLFLGFAGVPLGLIIFTEGIAPMLMNASEDNYVPTELMSANYSSNVYKHMEIYRGEGGCGQCGTFDSSFTKIVSERDFRPNYVYDIDEATNEVFKKDFHHYSRWVAMSLNVSKAMIFVEYNSQAMNMISVAVNMINNALLTGFNASISAAANVQYVSHRRMPAKGEPPQAGSSFVELIGFQSLYYLILMQTERATGAKALQLMATPAWIYWTSQFIFDLLVYIPFISFSALIYYALSPGDDLFSTSPVAIVLWGGGLILISYVITCYIKTRSNCVSVSLLVYFAFFSIFPVLLETGLLPKWISYLHPTTILKGAVGRVEPTDGMYLLYLMLYWVFMLAFLVLTESTVPFRMLHALMSRISSVKYNIEGPIDQDVDNEAEEVEALIQATNRQPDTLLVSRLKRWYGLLPCRPHAAVRGVSFKVQPGECFGLLGVNGAGKSSTFNMIATQIPCSDGDAVLNNCHLSDLNTKKYLSQMSYCPQTSGIIPKLTGKEFLALFARLRGYKEHQVTDIVHQWVRLLDLQEVADRPCGRYSGGMERKLIAAAAFVWDSSVVMLDEPTSGVDPVARRSIWKAVTSAQQAGKSVVLTSHSMEECEALCSRLTIMVDGSFRCIGETTTLKNKFGGGYSVQLKLSPCTADEAVAFEKAVTYTLGQGCKLTDRHCSILHYHIDGKTTGWKTLFTKLESLKAEHSVLESYVASETTLEQIFLDFAGHRQVRQPETVVEISE